jgi:hypothetical protein
MKGWITGFLPFAEAALTGDVYLDKLEQFVHLQASDLQLNMF